MILSRALAILGQSRQRTVRRELFLACGFQPLHLATFLRAHFAERFPDQALDLHTGLYGNIEASLTTAAGSQASAAAVVLEWSDLDPRLGLRSSGGWGPAMQQEILAHCQQSLTRLVPLLQTLAGKMPVALAAPTLRPTLFGQTVPGQLSLAEAELEQHLATFLAAAARMENVSVLHPGQLARLSPQDARLDAKLELGAGFPYSLTHASALAQELIRLLYPSAPFKGLITDLDDTLWAGIAGEIGAASVSWDLSGHAQLHGLYQQQLRQLSEMGVLLAVASKNEPAVVSEALQRPDLFLPQEAFFPVCVSWNPKSQAVGDILRTWNIGPESVVFVDDSPMELAEVQAAFPGVTGLLFPRDNPAEAVALLEQLRALFGKPVLQKEDSLRLSSIRANAQLRQDAQQSTSGDFLAQLEGRVTFDPAKDSGNKRLLELINKTNQFNLNGKRLDAGDWSRLLEEPSSFVRAVSYQDKLGPLGTISVIAGRRAGSDLEISTWVLSCRAFSRQIEFHTLEHLFLSTDATEITFAFQPTERNQPLQNVLRTLALPVEKTERLRLSREAFVRLAPKLPHLAESVQDSRP